MVERDPNRQLSTSGKAARGFENDGLFQEAWDSEIQPSDVISKRTSKRQRDDGEDKFSIRYHAEDGAVWTQPVRIASACVNS